MVRMAKTSKAMIVTCNYAFCIYNEGKKCICDEITLSMDGVCERAFDRMKYTAARCEFDKAEVLKEIRGNK